MKGKTCTVRGVQIREMTQSTTVNLEQSAIGEGQGKRVRDDTQFQRNIKKVCADDKEELKVGEAGLNWPQEYQ